VLVRVRVRVCLEEDQTAKNTRERTKPENRNRKTRKKKILSK